MRTQIEETFEILAPVDTVWAFLMDPQRVVECMPGAELEEMADERTFIGNIKLKVGFVALSYKMRGRFTEIDHEAHFARIEAEGQEGTKCGGAAKGTMTSTSRALLDGGTEVRFAVEMELTGRMIEYGKGMVRSVSRQITKKFVRCAKNKLEAGGQP